MTLEINTVVKKTIPTIFEKKSGVMPVYGYVEGGVLNILAKRRVKDKDGSYYLTPIVSFVITQKELELALATIKDNPVA